MSENRAIICLGANTPDAAERLARAFDMLGAMGAVLRSTMPYPTAPEYAGEDEPYLNQIVELATPHTFEHITEVTKKYQTAVRQENKYPGRVNIDIDIVEWNGAIKRPADAASAYYRQGIDLLS